MSQFWSKKWFVLAALPLVMACGDDDVAGNDATDDGDPGVAIDAEELSWQLELGQSETSQFNFSNIGDDSL